MNLANLIFDSTFLTSIGWTLFHSVWQIGVIAVLFHWFRVATGSNVSATNSIRIYWAGCVAMLATIVLPVITYSFQSIPATQQTELISFAHLVDELIVGTSESNFVALNQPQESSTDLNFSRKSHLAALEGFKTNSNKWSSSIQPWLQITAIFWTLGVLLFSLRPILGLWRIRILKIHGRMKLPKELANRCRAQVETMQIKQAVDFGISKLVNVPTVIGCLRPIVLFPLSAISQLSPQQIELIARHELAHICRNDYLVNLLQTVVETVLFFHPCIWWISAIVRQERENCCDDMATETSESSNAFEFAQALLILEGQKSVKMLPALTASGGNLLARIDRLVSGNCRTKKRPFSWSASLLAASIGLFVLMISHADAGSFRLAGSPQDSDSLRSIENDFAKTKLGLSIDKELSKLKQVGFSGSILVAHKGEIILAKSNGFADLDESEPIKPDSLFEIASITTSFTCTSIMMLVERGDLKLNDSIADYLPAVPEHSKKIQVRHLMQHAAGIPGTNYGITNRGLELAVESMLHGGPQSKPGTKYVHWNQGIILLSEIVAKASGQSYVDFVRENIFQPCKMNGTCFTGDEKPEGFNITIGTGTLGKPRTCLEHPYGSYGLTYRGVGGIVTNTMDLYKFARAVFSDNLITSKSRKTMLDAGDIKFYGLGWFTTKTANGKNKIANTGKVRGFTSSLAVYPESDSCIIVLSNSDTGTSQTVAGVIEGMLFPAGLGDSIASDVAAKYVGTYKNHQGRIIELEQIEKHLTYKVLWSPTLPNGPVSRGYVQKKGNKIVFYQPNETTVVTPKFSKDKSKVQSIRYAKMLFKRVN